MQVTPKERGRGPGGHLREEYSRQGTASAKALRQQELRLFQDTEEASMAGSVVRRGWERTADAAGPSESREELEICFSEPWDPTQMGSDMADLWV